MRKHLTKLMALALAFTMTLAMSATVFAALGDDTTGAETGVQEGNATSVAIKTAVVITNNEGAAAKGKTIAYPAMSFKYTVEPATVAAGTTVTDQDDEPGYHTGTDSRVTVEVKAGPADGITATTSNIAAGTVVLNDNGQEAVAAETTFAGDISKFTAAGIYRYKITDASATDSENKTALETAGVVQGTSADKEYFLDVYVKNIDTAPYLAFGGFVLLNENPGSIDKQANENIDKKESGFDEVDIIVDPTTGEVTLKPDTPADITKNYSYTTYNITLNKAVKGGLGDKKHGFPFAVAVGVQTGHPTLGYGYEVTGSDLAACDHTYNALEAIPATQNMSNNSTLKIWGLSPFATINYTETNDTESEYLVKVGSAADGAQFKTEAKTAKNGTVAAWDAVKNVADNYAINATATLNADADAVYYTNTLNDISPTGVVLRFAPYIFIAAAAVLLLVFARRRREDY